MGLFSLGFSSRRYRAFFADVTDVTDVTGRDFGAITFVGPLTVCFCSYF
jgi:hypothetical protein